MHSFPFMMLLSFPSGADFPVVNALMTKMKPFSLPFCGNNRETSMAVKPFLPILPCCCFTFQAVLGRPL